MKSNIKALNNSELLARLEQSVTQHLEKAISIFQNCNYDQLMAPSAQMGWSIAQCLEHLNTYSAFYLPKISDSIKQQPVCTNEEFVSGWLGRYFVAMIDPDKSAKKYKAAKQHAPISNLDPHKVVSIFIDHQEELLNLLQQCYFADLNRIRIQTSISSLVSLKLGDILQFLIVHDERHIRQAMRNLSL